MPRAGAHHSAQALNVHEQYYLADCGEGTQSRLMEVGINPLKINAIFISHLHGDHLYGLFPLISTLGLMGRKTPLQVFAPAPLGELFEAMDTIMGEQPPFPVQFTAVDTRVHEMVYENRVMEVWSIPLRHRIPAAGYLFREKTPPLNIRKEAVELYGLGVAQIVAAKAGRDITLDDGRLVPNAELTYTPYHPRSYAYCSDTTRSGKVASLVEGADMLYHEATFSVQDKNLAKQTGHSTATDAAKVALGAGVGKLLIGHFSGRYKDTVTLLEEARAIFPQTYIATESETFEIAPRRTGQTPGSGA